MPPSSPVVDDYRDSSSATDHTVAALLDATISHSAGGRWLVSDSALPDDALVAVLSFTDTRTPATLLSVSRRWTKRLRSREGLWRVLAMRQESWRSRLPSRPRKAWADVFLAELQREERERKMRSDDVLKACHLLLRKGDNVVAVRKVVESAQQAFHFSVDHQSGVVLERNPLLNLSVMLARPKVAHWLVVECGASVHKADNGGFTPLMDAAWSGDRELVRLLLHFGAHCKNRGHSHFSGGIKATTGPWHDAAGWAETKGKKEVAAHLRQWASTDPHVISSVRARAMAAAKEAAAKAKQQPTWQVMAAEADELNAAAAAAAAAGLDHNQS